MICTLQFNKTNIEFISGPKRNEKQYNKTKIEFILGTKEI